MPIELVLWEFIRAFGVLAYLLLSAAVVMGMGVKSRLLEPLLKRPWAYELHQTLSLGALITVVVHAVLTLGNSHVPFGVADVLIPFLSGWRPLAVALGIAAMYLVALVVVSTAMKARVGQRAWRAMHYSSFLAWAFALLHGVAAGSDSGLMWVRLIYLLSAAVVAFVLTYRILLPLPPKQPVASRT